MTCKDCNNIVIHNWKSAKVITATASFRKDKKIILQIAMLDVDAILAYLDRTPIFKNIPYRIINHIE